MLRSQYNTCMTTLLLILCSIFLYVTPYLNFELFFLSWFFFIPIIFLLERGKISPVRLGLIFGIASNLIATYWVSPTISNLTGAGLGLATSVHLLYSIYESIFFILVFLLVTLSLKKIKNIWFKYIFIIFIYVIFEQNFPRIFPYKLGNSQIIFTEISQLISILGINIISILVLIFNICLYEILFKKKIDVLYILIGIFLLAFYSGRFLENNFQNNFQKVSQIKIALIQPVNSLKEIIKIQKEINLENHQYDIIVWPESSLNKINLKRKEDYKEFQDAFYRNFKFNSKYLLLGSIIENDNGYFNSAILINSEYKIQDLYSKNKLMIFGEFYPLKNILSTIMPIYREFVELKRGEIKVVKTAGGLILGIVICYEDLFEDNAAQLAQLNSEILINLTNGKWYGDTLATYQHLMLAIPRAIENRRFLVRSTYNGVSAIISPKGEIINKIPKNKVGYISNNVSLIRAKSFYSIYKSQIKMIYHVIFGVLLILFLIKLRNK